MSNMYSRSVCQWNPFVGCKFDCIYCRKSFQSQMKRQKHRCQKCYDFEPHEHPERLDQYLPKTDYGQFIFACANGDISFCSTPYLMRIVHTIEKWPDRTFLIQSKNPKTFERVAWPDNVILGTTIETDDDGVVAKFSQAPLPATRCADFLKITHPLKMLTFEPIMDFSPYLMIEIVKEIQPCMVWLGYDTKKTGLPEPPLEKVKELYWELGRLGFTVILKKV
ncbi:MAG: hypothetical protein MUP81_03370 [Dehalococcoidia bacterium]|nr:hypothetical protein [Dehalococcoidia bacterium]